METMTPTAQILIDHYFDRALTDLGAEAAARTRRVQRHFGEFAEREGARIMVAHQLAEPDLEREIDPVGAVGRVLVPIDILWLLVLYLEPAQLLPVRVDARRQLRLMAGLAQKVIDAYGWEQVACCALDVHVALARLRELVG